MVDLVLARAMTRTGVIWIEVADGARAHAAWHIWREGAAYVVVGGPEQEVPGLVDAERATVIVPSKTSGARILTWAAVVTSVAPASDEWTQVVGELRSKRLNAADGEGQPERWARESTVLRLRPHDEPSTPPH